MNSKKLFTELALKINLSEPADEINQLVFMVMEYVFGLSSTEVLIGKNVEWSQLNQSKVNTIIDRLNSYEPIQYILGEAEFFRRKFLVNSSVLIPRPETEELIHAVRSSLPSGKVRLLDIGTGSGCIAITLKLEIPEAETYATDISDLALATAQQNAIRLMSDVSFLKHDILKEEIPFNNLDVIVSNPPYIVAAEKKSMQKNVLDYEPHLALFVPDEDPLLFYNAIAVKGKFVLKPGGKVIVEINERLGDGVANAFLKEGYANISVLKDINDKDRIVMATHTPR